MASQTPLSLGLLFLVLCLTHGSARKLVPDFMLKDTTELARRLSDEPAASDSQLMSSAPMPNEPTGLAETQVACGHRVEVLAPPIGTNCPYDCPSCACGGPANTVAEEPTQGIVVYLPPTPTGCDHPSCQQYAPSPYNGYPPACHQPGCQAQGGTIYYYPPGVGPSNQPGPGQGVYPGCGEPSCQRSVEPVCTNLGCQFVPPYPTAPQNLPQLEPTFPASVGKPQQETASGEIQTETLETSESVLEGGSPAGSH